MYPLSSLDLLNVYKHYVYSIMERFFLPLNGWDLNLLRNIYIWENVYTHNNSTSSGGIKQNEDISATCIQSLRSWLAFWNCIGVLFQNKSWLWESGCSYTFISSQQFSYLLLFLWRETGGEMTFFFSLHKVFLFCLRSYINIVSHRSHYLLGEKKAFYLYE